MTQWGLLSHKTVCQVDEYINEHITLIAQLVVHNFQYLEGIFFFQTSAQLKYEKIIFLLQAEINALSPKFQISA